MLFVSIFLVQRRFYDFRELRLGVPQKFGSGHQMSRVYTSHKNNVFQTMRKNVLTFPQEEKAHARVGEPTATTRKEKKEER